MKKDHRLPIICSWAKMSACALFFYFMVAGISARSEMSESTTIDRGYSSSGCAAFDDDGRIFGGPARGFIVDERAPSINDPVYDRIIAADPSALPRRTAVFQFYVSWKDVEPKEGQFEFARLDDIMAGLHKLGKRVVWRLDCSMGDLFPDSGYPQWLLDLIPDVDKRLVPFGPKRPWLKRAEISYENEAFQTHLKSLIRKLVDRYNGNPDLEYLDLRVVSRYGEWGGWDDADHFVFTHKRQTLTNLIDIYGEAFTKTKVAMQVSGRRHHGDPITDMTDWCYDLIWKRKYPNFIIRTDTNTAACDYLSKFYPTAKFLTAWLFERFSAKTITTFEGVGTWRDYKSTIYSPDTYVDNALFRLRSNYGCWNNLAASDMWPTFFDPIFAEATDRLERNFAYRVRPAYVSWRTVRHQGKQFLEIDQAWVNAGVGSAPADFYPAILVSDSDTGKEWVRHVICVPAAQLCNLRNSDYVELQSTVEIPPQAGSQLILRLAAQNSESGEKLEIPVQAAKNGKEVMVARICSPSQGSPETPPLGDTLKRMSCSYEAEAAWNIQNARVERSPGGGPISPRLEKVTDCQNAVLTWADVNVPEDGTYRVGFDVQSDSETKLLVGIDGSETEIPVSSTGPHGADNPPVEFFATLKLSSGMHNITLKTPDSQKYLSIDRMRIEKTGDNGKGASLPGCVLGANRLAQTSKSDVAIGTLPWWSDYWNAIKDAAWCNKTVDKNSPVHKADIAVRKNNDGFYLDGLRTGSWLEMAPFYIQEGATYRAVIEATIEGGPPEIQTVIDGCPVARTALQTEAVRSHRYEIAPKIFLNAGVHDIRLNIIKGDVKWIMQSIKIEPVSK